METVAEFFSYDFIKIALIVGELVAVCSALLGASLVLKRYSMIGDGLSHVGFGALSIAVALNFSPLNVAIPTVVTAAFFLLRISRNSRINGDAAIALISTSAIAVGVFVTSMTTGLNIDVTTYLFGSIFALSGSDVILSIIITALIILLYLLFYNRIFSVTFDEAFAKATGVRAGLYNMLMALLTAMTIVVGMRIMGTLLISSLIIFPSLTSMNLFKSFKSVIISSAVISAVCFFWGIVCSFLFSSPPGATIVLINLCVFIIFYLITLLKKIKKEN